MALNGPNAVVGGFMVRPDVIFAIRQARQCLANHAMPLVCAVVCGWSARLTVQRTSRAWSFL